MDVLVKKLTNDKSEIYKNTSMYNNLNIGSIINNVDETSPIRFTWEGNWYGEKRIQAVKDQFISQKGNFGKILINKIYTKKILDHLSPEESIKLEIPSKF